MKKKIYLSYLFMLTIIFTFIVFPLCGARMPEAAENYEAVIIEPLLNQNSCKAYGINNLGQVVGSSYDYDTNTGNTLNMNSFIWDQENGYKMLPPLAEDADSSVWGINDNGDVSGESYDSLEFKHSVRWNDTAGAIENIFLVDLGTLHNAETGVFGDESRSYDINNLGQVAGHSDIPNDDESFSPFHGFIYDDAEGILDLGTLTTHAPQWQNGYSITYDINNNSIAVGTASDSSWGYLPFIYDETGMHQLNIAPEYASGEWHAVAINDAGFIGGHVVTGNGSLPYYWENTYADPVSVIMPEDFPYGEIYGVNEAGKMVGIMWNNEGVEHAFVFDITNGVYDLNDITSIEQGYVLIFARDINEHGQISGTCELNGEKRGFILNLFDTCACDLNNDGRCDMQDWRIFGTNWGRTDCHDSGVDCQCDLNDDGRCDMQDWRIFGEDWGRTDCPVFD